MGICRKRGRATHERVEACLGVELHLLLLHANGVIRILLLDFRDLGLHDLHVGRGLNRLGLQRGQDEANDEGQDDDSQAPVARDAMEPLEHHGQEVNEPIPHVSSVAVPGQGTGSYPPLWKG